MMRMLYWLSIIAEGIALASLLMEAQWLHPFIHVAVAIVAFITGWMTATSVRDLLRWIALAGLLALLFAGLIIWAAVGTLELPFLTLQ